MNLSPFPGLRPLGWVEPATLLHFLPAVRSRWPRGLPHRPATSKSHGAEPSGDRPSPRAPQRVDGASGARRLAEAPERGAVSHRQGRASRARDRPGHSPRHVPGTLSLALAARRLPERAVQQPLA